MKKKQKDYKLENVAESLRTLYKQKLLPLEEHHKFHDFHSPALGLYVRLKIIEFIYPQASCN